MQASVVSVNISDYEANVIISSGVEKTVTIPASLGVVEPGCTVELNEGSTVILAVISYPSMPRNHSDIDTQESGFINFFKGLFSIGISDTSKISFMNNLIDIISDEINLTLKKNKISIKATNYGAVISVLIGGLSFSTDSKGLLNLNIFDKVNIKISPGETSFSVTSEDGKTDSVKIQQNPLSRIINYVITISRPIIADLKDITLNSGDITAVTGDVNISSSSYTESVSGSKNTHSYSSVESVEMTKKLIAQNLKFKVGGTTGSLFDISNGLTQGMSLDAIKQTISAKSLLGFDIYGTGDAIPSSLILTSILIAMNAAIVQLAAAVPLGPLGAPQAAVAAATSATAVALIPTMPNYMLRTGLIPNPFL